MVMAVLDWRPAERTQGMCWSGRAVLQQGMDALIYANKVVEVEMLLRS